MRFPEDPVFKLSKVSSIARKTIIRNKMIRESILTIVSKFHRHKIPKNRSKSAIKPI
jgi:hypothetical protein